jgi:GrpB-like predicted nucleotidyltransferase (UPF0157 family)
MLDTDPIQMHVNNVTAEMIDISPYNPDWPAMFEAEKNELIACLPEEMIERIEHFGSTAVPGLSAKPIIDMLVGVTSLEETKKRIVPILTSKGYEYFWRPAFGDSTPPFYAWFIKRNSAGKRTHHIHMIEKNSNLWDRLLFRDYLIGHREIAVEYERLKMKLVNEFQGDRCGYTGAKSEFIVRIMTLARKYYESSGIKDN